MDRITAISARTVQDSRNHPALAVRVEAGGASGEFLVPSGASTGSREARELRDPAGGVDIAIANVEKVAPLLVGMQVTDQRALDARLLSLDNTPDKSRLGGNTLIGLSVAAAKAAAVVKKVELFEHLRSLADIPTSQRVPQLYLNYINGGKHADSPISFQEHIIVPQTDSVAEAMSMALALEAALGAAIDERYGAGASSHTGDEGGFALPDANYRAPFEILSKAVHDAGLIGSVRFAIDAAATSFFKDGAYTVGGETLDPAQLRDLYVGLKEFDLLSIEDPFDEESFADFAALQGQTSALLVGDDLTVTNAARIAQAADAGAIRAVIIKPNQVGTLSETLDAMKLARERGLECIVSHRSGETTDTFVADLAFAFGTFGLKGGALRQKERRVKYERLLTISL